MTNEELNTENMLRIEDMVGFKLEPTEQLETFAHNLCKKLLDNFDALASLKEQPSQHDELLMDLIKFVLFFQSLNATSLNRIDNKVINAVDGVARSLLGLVIGNGNDEDDDMEEALLKDQEKLDALMKSDGEVVLNEKSPWKAPKEVEGSAEGTKN